MSVAKSQAAVGDQITDTGVDGSSARRRHTDSVSILRFVRTSRLLRAERVGRTEKRWVVSLLGDLSGRAVDSRALSILCAAANGAETQLLLERFYPGQESLGERTIGALLQQQFLVGSDEQDALSELSDKERQIELWRKSGWRASATYHFHTYGYPFEVYTGNNESQEDARRMYIYGEGEADTDRGKTYASASTVQLPAPKSQLVETSIRELFQGHVLPQPLNAENLSRLISLGMGVIGTTSLPWPGAKPVNRRTSPSGGARHPTEGYLLNLSVNGLPLGWSHVDSVGCRLERISDLTEQDHDLTTFFSSLVNHARFTPQAVLLYTCAFRRNRYRYREPRTFRTIHMDAGHLMTTAEIIASSLGISAAALNVVNSRKLGERLSLEPLVEVPMSAVLLGSQHSGGYGSEVTP